MPVVGYFTTLEVLGHFLYPVFSFVYKRSIYALYVCLVASRKQSLSVNIANQRPSPSATLQVCSRVISFFSCSCDTSFVIVALICCKSIVAV